MHYVAKTKRWKEKREEKENSSHVSSQKSLTYLIDSDERFSRKTKSSSACPEIVQLYGQVHQLLGGPVRALFLSSSAFGHILF